MASLRWGILGTARVARQWVAAARLCPATKVHGIASRTLGLARSFASEHGLPRAYGSYGDLLNDDDIDAVYIPLPNSCHFSWTESAIRHGKHVLCEKPLSTSAKEVERLLVLRNQHQVHVAEGFANLYHPQFLSLYSIYNAGGIGDIRAIECAYSTPLLQRGGIVADLALGGGALLALGCYCLSFAIALLKESPTAICNTKSLARSGVDEYFSAYVQFPHAAISTVFAAITGPRRESVIIHGEHAIATFVAPFRPDLDGNSNGFVVTDLNGTSRQFDFASCNPFTAEIDAFTQTALGNRAPSPWPLELSALCSKLIETLLTPSERA